MILNLQICWLSYLIWEIEPSLWRLEEVWVWKRWKYYINAEKVITVKSAGNYFNHYLQGLPLLYLTAHIQVTWVTPSSWSNCPSSNSRRTLSLLLSPEKLLYCVGLRSFIQHSLEGESRHSSGECLVSVGCDVAVSSPTLLLVTLFLSSPFICWLAFLWNTRGWKPGVKKMGAFLSLWSSTYCSLSEMFFPYFSSKASHELIFKDQLWATIHIPSAPLLKMSSPLSIPQCFIASWHIILLIGRRVVYTCGSPVTPLSGETCWDHTTGNKVGQKCTQGSILFLVLGSHQQECLGGYLIPISHRNRLHRRHR